MREFYFRKNQTLMRASEEQQTWITCLPAKCSTCSRDRNYNILTSRPGLSGFAVFEMWFVRLITQTDLLRSTHREGGGDQAKLAAATPRPQLVLGWQSQTVLASKSKIRNPDRRRRSDIVVDHANRRRLWNWWRKKKKLKHIYWLTALTNPNSGRKKSN